jgi:excisionase family DNA binding protein
MKKMLLVREAADLTHVSEGFMRRLIREGRGPAVIRPGLPGDRRMLITEDALSEWFNARTQPAGTKAPAAR